MSDDVHHDPAALSLSWDDMQTGGLALLPSGPVWPRDRQGTLARTVRGLVGGHWRAWQRVGDMLDEADPRTCYETVDMWETDCGLPDPCIPDPPTAIELRRLAILARRHEGGTTTPMDFVELAATLGYEITIGEYRPFRTWSGCDSFLNTDIEGWPHTWMVTILNPGALVVTNMVCTSPCDAFLREWATGALECLFERIKPAHTQIIWAYPP
jgi:uncharacterized protein YmfQ (DUF2313 family)